MHLCLHLISRRIHILGLSLFLAAIAAAAPENWTAWRGPRGDGTSAETRPPTRWSATENVAWKVAVPGEGHSSPIIWEDRLFLTTSLAATQERVLLCLDRRTGATLWRQTVVTSPLEPKHKENSHASATPATNGRQVFVSFLDREEVVVAAYDFTGRQLWQARPGKFKSGWGFCHPPVLWEDLVVASAYSKGENFVYALRQSDGAVAWKTPGDNASQSYSPPLVRTMAGRAQMVLPGNSAVTSYDPRTGRMLWKIGGVASDAVITPVYSEKAGLLLSTTSWPSRLFVAIRPDGEGDVTATKVAWRNAEGTPYVPSPVAVDDWFFASSFQDKALYCYEAATGKVLWKQAGAGLHHASPVVAAGLVYFQSDAGVTRVFRAAAAYEEVAVNELGEPTYASPVFYAGQVFLRSFQHLYCIGPKS